MSRLKKQLKKEWEENKEKFDLEFSEEEGKKAFENFVKFDKDKNIEKLPVKERVDYILKKEGNTREKILRLEDIYDKETDLIDKILAKKEDILDNEKYLNADNKEKRELLEGINIVDYRQKGIEQLIVCKKIGDFYAEQGLYKKAFIKYKEALEVNPSDIFDVKYSYIKLCIYTNRERKLKKYIKSYDYKKDINSLFLLIIFYISCNRFNKAHNYMRLLKEKNINLEEVFKEEFIDTLYKLAEKEELQEYGGFSLSVIKEFIRNEYYYEVLKKLYYDQKF